MEVWWEPNQDHQVWGGNPEDKLIRLERSETGGAPWSTLFEGVLDRWHHRDHSAVGNHAFRKWWYRVGVVEPGTGAVHYSDPFTRQAQPSLEALEISARFGTVLRTRGREVFLYRKKTFGHRCTKCWDPVSMSTRTKQCNMCFGTGFIGGYHAPFRIYMKIDPYADMVQSTATGPIAVAKTTAMCLPFPDALPGSLIIEGENIRWVVETRTNTELQRAPVRSQLQLHKMPTSDICYNVPVRIALEDYNPTPPSALHGNTSDALERRIDLASWDPSDIYNYRG